MDVKFNILPQSVYDAWLDYKSKGPLFDVQYEQVGEQ